MKTNQSFLFSSCPPNIVIKQGEGNEFMFPSLLNFGSFKKVGPQIKRMSKDVELILYWCSVLAKTKNFTVLNHILFFILILLFSLMYGMVGFGKSLKIKPVEWIYSFLWRWHLILAWSEKFSACVCLYFGILKLLQENNEVKRGEGIKMYKSPIIKTVMGT